MQNYSKCHTWMTEKYLTATTNNSSLSNGESIKWQCSLNWIPCFQRVTLSSVLHHFDTNCESLCYQIKFRLQIKHPHVPERELVIITYLEQVPITGKQNKKTQFLSTDKHGGKQIKLVQGKMEDARLTNSLHPCVRYSETSETTKAVIPKNWNWTLIKVKNKQACCINKKNLRDQWHHHGAFPNI